MNTPKQRASRHCGARSSKSHPSRTLPNADQNFNTPTRTTLTESGVLNALPGDLHPAIFLMGVAEDFNFTAFDWLCAVLLMVFLAFATFGIVGFLEMVR